MEIQLFKKPQGVKIIEGFPGFGLIGSITTEFLVDHLKCELIGRFLFEDQQSTVLIHKGKITEPLGIFYNQKHNIVIIHSISAAQGIEWKAADIVMDVAKQLKAKEIISLEGVGSAVPTTSSNIFYYTNVEKNRKNLEGLGTKLLQDGIIMGVTSAVMLKTKTPLTCFFAETHSALPDSKAAAKVIETLDKYLNLKVDPNPLLKQAQKFEDKLKSMMQQSQDAQEMQEKKQLSYVG
ncbi:MAG: PAC2 family protein [Candidatus Woesearchaeota archaeon]|nr:PAC2 family protein [Candidatus Woesearchaeota archaeon]MDP7323644.1 PAC2 family protein [Candidatus Woesearchaeota archaeon]MDP7458553.1 PAC2 family protein [Candidatus Woesearchaeota archaeon]